MKKLVLTLLLAMLLPVAAFSQYQNPVINADMSDPDVIRVGEKYYLISSEFHFMGMPIYESSDLVNWRPVGKVYDHLPFKEYDTMARYAGGSWAPVLRYHNGEFYVYFCTPDEGLFMTKSKRAEGPWEPLHCVKAVKKWEDPCPFWDEDGQAYLGHSLWGAGPIIIHKMSADGRELLDDGVTVYTGPVAEGTKIHKFSAENNAQGTEFKPYYYMSIPEGGVGGGWQTILRSESIYGPWERKVVLETGSTDINGPHQGSIIDTPDRGWWFFHFQETDALGRVLHLQPMHWGNDGWPVIGVDYDGNGIGEPVAGGYFVPQSAKAVTLTNNPLAKVKKDHTIYTGFTTGMCPWTDLSWQFNHNPDSAAFSLTEVPGAFTIHALPAKKFREARNTLTRKAVGFNSEYITAVDLGKMVDGQKSGMVCMGGTNRTVGAVMKGGKKYVYIEDDEAETIIGELPSDVLYLRLTLDMPNKTFRFYYSLDGVKYVKAGENFYIRNGFWKGVRPGLFTYNTAAKKGTHGSASFLWFKQVIDEE